jgi:hypothetical protein
MHLFISDVQDVKILKEEAASKPVEEVNNSSDIEVIEDLSEDD